MGFDIFSRLCIRYPGRKMMDLGSGPSIPRNNGLYGLMAGVRGVITLFEPRGLPDDVPDTVAWALRDGPGAEEDFAHSWLTTDEVREVWETYESHPELAGRPCVPAGFAAAVGAMEAVDRWCAENGGGEAILVISFG
jgi:hypothetical protein